jgi:hypothetical protein
VWNVNAGPRRSSAAKVVKSFITEAGCIGALASCETSTGPRVGGLHDDRDRVLRDARALERCRDGSGQVRSREGY